MDSQVQVIDHDADDRTTSEGQAYGMFFALVANDRSQFDRILHWTEQNLADGDLSAHLPAWLWGRSQNNQWAPETADSSTLFVIEWGVGDGRLGTKNWDHSVALLRAFFPAKRHRINEFYPHSGPGDRRFKSSLPDQTIEKKWFTHLPIMFFTYSNRVIVLHKKYRAFVFNSLQHG